MTPDTKRPGAPGSHYVRAGGVVHLLSPLQAGEYTMCGVAFDACDTEGEPGHRFVPVREQPVNCDMCVDMIERCRGVRVSAKPRPMRTRQ